MQKAELDRDIERLQASVQTGKATITPDKLKRLAEGPPELRQAYMRLILDSVTIDPALMTTGISASTIPA
jgi:hypothetical protein